MLHPIGSSLATDCRELNVIQVTPISALGTAEDVYEIVVLNRRVAPARDRKLMGVEEEPSGFAAWRERSELHIVEVVTLPCIASENNKGWSAGY